MKRQSTVLAAVSAATFALLATPASQTHAQELAEAVVKHREMVVTANPIATAAGERILRRGGTAADAMVAVQTVLGLVEPQSSGIGGGAFIVYYDARRGKTITVDAREKAPAAATEDRFSELGFFDAWQSGLSVGVPGVPRMMEYMHRRYGKKRWRSLFRPAIRLARHGFELTERTSSQVAGLLARNESCEERRFFRDPTAFEYFADDCEAKPAGTVVRNRPYAQTLRTLARDGSRGFYNGPIAADIAAAVQGDLGIPGDMTVEDLANYNVVIRRPVCLNYRGNNVCGMGPPSSGALAVGQILGVLENFDLSEFAPLDVETVHLFTQAGRIAFADRGLYVGDPDFVTVPVAGMLDKDYLASRVADVITDMDFGTVEPGTPPGEFDPLAPHNRAKDSGTSHVSIVDRYGNALSMTTTIESSFGNGVMVRGFLLNNELTDFSFAAADDDGTPIANRVQPNKRPRSSMSPTIVFDKRGRVKLVTGSPGGSRIIGYTAQSVMNVIDFGLDPQEAINVPHYMNRNGSTDIETPIPGITLDYDAEALAAALEGRGHTVNIRTQTSGVSTVEVTRERYGHSHRYRHYFGHGRGRGYHRHYRTKLIGGADKRRDGTVGGR